MENNRKEFDKKFKSYKRVQRVIGMLYGMALSWLIFYGILILTKTI